MHAQLKDGDRLEIKLKKATYRCQHIDIDYPCFEIVHVLGDRKAQVIGTYSPGFHSASAGPLYD